MKSNASVYSLYYTEACNQLGGLSPRHCAYGQHSSFRRNVAAEPLVTLHLILVTRDLNLRPLASEVNALLLDLLPGVKANAIQNRIALTLEIYFACNPSVREPRKIISSSLAKHIIIIISLSHLIEAIGYHRQYKIYNCIFAVKCPQYFSAQTSYQQCFFRWTHTRRILCHLQKRILICIKGGCSIQPKAYFTVAKIEI